MSPGRHGERVPVPFAAFRCRARPCIGIDLRWSEPRLTPTGLGTVWLTIQSAFARARKRRACATLPEPLAPVVHARRKIARAPFTRLAPRCPVEGTSAPVGLFDSGADLSIARSEPKKTRSAELCNPRCQRRAPVLGVAAARLASTRLAPSGELCAPTATKPALAGLSWRGGRAFSARSRAHSGPTADAPSPAALHPSPRCGLRLHVADRDRFHRRHVEWRRLPRSETPSIDKEPGRLFTLGAFRFRMARAITTLLRPLRIYRAGLGPAHRSQPRPRAASWVKRRLPTSATISQNTGTPSDRPFLARSSPFRRSSLPRWLPERDCERHGTGRLF